MDRRASRDYRDQGAGEEIMEMLNWRVEGADITTGEDRLLFLEAHTEESARAEAQNRGVVISSIDLSPEQPGEKSRTRAILNLGGTLLNVFLVLVAVFWILEGTQSSGIGTPLAWIVGLLAIIAITVRRAQ